MAKLADQDDGKGKGRAVDDDPVLIIFIHGFKGSQETTFADFPNRLAHILSSTMSPGTKVLCEVFPTYETRGKLEAAVERLSEWVVERCARLESEEDEDYGSGSAQHEQAQRSEEKQGLESSPKRERRRKKRAKVVLCGHSMGGLVAVDAAMKLEQASWPAIVGVLAFDTPYYGVHPSVFKNTATKYGGYLKQAHSVGSQVLPLVSSFWAAKAVTSSASSSSVSPQQRITGAAGEGGGQQQPQKSRNWMYATAALAAIGTGAAATTATFFGTPAYNYLTDHFLFVSHLWDDKALRSRLEAFSEKQRRRGTVFRVLYNRLPPLERGMQPRTFVVLPSQDASSFGAFEAVDNAVSCALSLASL